MILTCSYWHLSDFELLALVPLDIYLYQDVAAAKADEARLHTDTRLAVIEWVRPPHFYRCTKMIVLYTGEDETITRVLTGLCGPAFRVG